jgi:ATP-dependent Lon protease
MPEASTSVGTHDDQIDIVVSCCLQDLLERSKDMATHFMQPDIEASRLKKIPSDLPILPLPNTLAYPFSVLPIAVGIQRSVKLIEDALQSDRLIGLAAIASLLSGRPVRYDVGMTGEITLRGRVLPVGGVKMKILVAHRAGLTTVLLPRRNDADLEELPDDVRQAMTFVPVEMIDEVLRTALQGKQHNAATAHAY